MQKMNPCKCGKEVMIDSVTLPKRFGVRVYFYCSNCMTFKTIIAERKRDAVAAWNKRVQEVSQ